MSIHPSDTKILLQLTSNIDLFDLCLEHSNDIILKILENDNIELLMRLHKEYNKLLCKKYGLKLIEKDESSINLTKLNFFMKNLIQSDKIPINVLTYCLLYFKDQWKLVFLQSYLMYNKDKFTIDQQTRIKYIYDNIYLGDIQHNYVYTPHINKYPRVKISRMDNGSFIEKIYLNEDFKHIEEVIGSTKYDKLFIIPKELCKEKYDKWKMDLLEYLEFFRIYDFLD